MILVTGATGFIGRHLIYRLAQNPKLQVRIFLRPGADLAKLPRPLSVHTMIGSIDDPESLLSAMNGIHTVIHLVGTESRGRSAQLASVDLDSTKALVDAALTARVGRIIYVSRPGADRASAFPVLRLKGEIEEIIRDSGLGFTIFRSAALFGANDRFSEHIAMLAGSFPFYIVPGDGESIFQPLWVEDFVSCLMIALESLDTLDTVVSVGGPELLTYRRMVMRVMHSIGVSRPIVGLPLLINQGVIWFLDGLFARWPITRHWIEMFASNQSFELGTIERQFGFRPASFDIGILSQYMQNRHYTARLARYVISSKW